jgi:hypothetical protein
LCEGIQKTGTIVDLLTGGSTAEVIFDSDSAKTTHKVAINKLSPLSELEIDPSTFPLSNESIGAFLYFLKNKESKEPGIPSWLYSELKSRALRALNKLLVYAPSAQLFIQTPGRHSW